MAKQILTATALALLLGVSAAAAQNGGEARSNDREMQKALDHRDLSPIRPIRRVGEDSWPTAKNQPAPAAATRETTGQSAKKEEPAKQEVNKQEVKQDTAKQDPKQDAKQETKQEPAKQEAAKPASQDTPKTDTAKQNTAQPEQKQDTAKQDAPKPDAKPQDHAQDKPQDNAQNNPSGKSDDKGFASIRLGTDNNGRVAINDAQERQITSAMRKHRIQTIDVAVSIGAVAPANARLGAVSGDIVAVLPQFRGYSYFATRENIVIVEPSGKKIVALVPVTLSATAANPQPERSVSRHTERGATHNTTTRTATKQPSSATVTRRETTGVAVAAEVPSEAEILASPVVTVPRQTTVTRTYRAVPSETVIIEHRRRPRILGLW